MTESWSELDTNDASIALPTFKSSHGLVVLVFDAILFVLMHQD